MKKDLVMTPAALSALGGGDLENFMVAATPGGIEAQEARGQRDLVAAASQLPKDCPRADLEALGFVFGADIEDLFISVKFPKGWSLKATSHSMHSDLLDDKGRKRAGIFYKAAFYDRKAKMYRLKSRYSVDAKYPEDDGPIVYSVKDADGTVLCDLGSVDDPRKWEEHEVLQAKGEAWLTEHFPEWENAKAYWN